LQEGTRKLEPLCLNASLALVDAFCRASFVAQTPEDNPVQFDVPENLPTNHPELQDNSTLPSLNL
jgi:hypothetical protein